MCQRWEKKAQHITGQKKGTATTAKARADGQSAGSGPGIRVPGKACASLHLQDGVGAHVLIQGHAPPRMREMSYGYLLGGKPSTRSGGTQPGE